MVRVTAAGAAGSKSASSISSAMSRPSPRHFTFHPSHQSHDVLRRYSKSGKLKLPLLGFGVLLYYGFYYWLVTVPHGNKNNENNNHANNQHNNAAVMQMPLLSSHTRKAPLLVKESKNIDHHIDKQVPLQDGDQEKVKAFSFEQQGQDNHQHPQDASSSSSTSDPLTAEPIKIAHTISLIKCAKEASVTGFLDAAAVLRHSIHKTSVHHYTTTTASPEHYNVVSDNNDKHNNNDHPHQKRPISKYSYQMYAIVHADNCASHAPLLENLGYKTLIRHSPVNRSDIVNESYRHFVQYENCCGLDEFIKLYAYTLLDHPISVHWDLDVAILQPLDELYDSMLFDKDSPQGQAARAKLRLSYPQQPLPDQIDAFYTKDVTSSQPWEERQGIQGGFLVARPSQEIFDKYVAFITEGNYIQGRGNGFGWQGLGFGGFQGAMAYQGATAYMYDIVHPGHAVPLNPCIYNQVVADVLWRGPHKMEHHLQCRQHPHDGYTHSNNTVEHGACQDCRITPVAESKTVHYTACKKPWECRGVKPRKPRDQSQVYRLENLTNRTTCHLLFAEWFRLRRDFELQLLMASSGRIQPSPHDGQYLPEAFLGYCKGIGQYVPMVPPTQGFDVSRMYGM